jgi:hypothetical protein
MREGELLALDTADVDAATRGAKSMRSTGEATTNDLTVPAKANRFLRQR